LRIMLKLKTPLNITITTKRMVDKEKRMGYVEPTTASAEDVIFVVVLVVVVLVFSRVTHSERK
jgi:hypothetical protein